MLRSIPNGQRHGRLSGGLCTSSSKSTTILENCLIPSRPRQFLRPLEDMLSTLREQASLRSSLHLFLWFTSQSLVSPTNYWRMKHTYQNLPQLSSDIRRTEVIVIKFEDRYLDAARMSTMALNGKEGVTPL